MESTTYTQLTRTERGMVIAGTRITLYDIMGYLEEDWPYSVARACRIMNLSREPGVESSALMRVLAALAAAHAPEGARTRINAEL